MHTHREKSRKVFLRRFNATLLCIWNGTQICAHHTLQYFLLLSFSLHSKPCLHHHHHVALKIKLFKKRPTHNNQQQIQVLHCTSFAPSASHFLSTLCMYMFILPTCKYKLAELMWNKYIMQNNNAKLGELIAFKYGCHIDAISLTTSLKMLVNVLHHKNTTYQLHIMIRLPFLWTSSEAD